MTEKRDRVLLGGGWKNKTRGGTMYLSCPLTSTSRLEVWPNPKKTSDKHPDFLFSIVAVQPREKKQEQPAVDNDPFSAADEGDDDSSMPF